MPGGNSEAQTSQPAKLHITNCWAHIRINPDKAICDLHIINQSEKTPLRSAPSALAALALDNQIPSSPDYISGNEVRFPYALSTNRLFSTGEIPHHVQLVYLSTQALRGRCFNDDDLVLPGCAAAATS